MRRLRRRYGHATRADLRAAKAAYEVAKSAAESAWRSAGFAGHGREEARRIADRAHELDRAADAAKKAYDLLRGKR